MLPTTQCNLGDGKMLDTNMWIRQINHVDSIRSTLSYTSSVKELNRLEYKDNMVLQHDEQLLNEAVNKNSTRKTGFTSRKYA
jgi:hypothetical protein